jgi:hypothetical protein
MGARRVPCGGENYFKQPHAGVSISLNRESVKPAVSLGRFLERSYGDLKRVAQA